MHSRDIRWEQRFANYKKAMAKLSIGVKINILVLSDLEKEGLIQRFEYTHELAWNVMKDYFEYQGNTLITGSRDATREAYNKGLIIDGEGWMDMIKSRNQTSHTYNEETAEEIIGKIADHYYLLFIDFQTKMESLRSGGQKNIFDSEL
jgi:nucleotidyltransferase substrate binding protein (TIGR01987 family)